MDLLPCRNEKVIHHSKQDQESVELLEAKTVCVDIDGIQWYSTPVLHVRDMPALHASKEAVIVNLRSTERRLSKDTERAAAYCAEINKLEQAGYVIQLPK